jgi:hypothetical protein
LFLTTLRSQNIVLILSYIVYFFDIVSPFKKQSKNNLETGIYLKKLSISFVAALTGSVIN